MSSIVDRLFESLKTETGQRNAMLGGGVVMALIFVRTRMILRQKAKRRKKGLSKKAKKGVNKDFRRNLKHLLKIIMPSWTCKEAFILYSHTFALMARTFLSIYVSVLDGAIVKSIVDRNKMQFLLQMAKWLLLAVPATYCNSMIRFFEAKLSLAFRTRLAKHAYTLYMKNRTYYTVQNLDSRLPNPDQNMTADIEMFCDNLASLYSSLCKPAWDLILMSAQLISLQSQNRDRDASSKPWWKRNFGLILGLSNPIITSQILKAYCPPFGQMVAQKANLDGDLRGLHSRLHTHAEEVAFYGGHEIESDVLHTAYDRLVKQENKILHARMPYTMLEQFLMKYVWSTVGLTMIAVQMLQSSDVNDSGVTVTTSDRSQGFVTARGLLAGTADAIERIISSLKDVAELAGYTQRVYDMLRVFSDVNDQKFEKRMSNNSVLDQYSGGSWKKEGESIVLENVPIITPNGDLLVKDMSLTVQPNQHILITGPNGCGKSSLFRVLGGLWPPQQGSVRMPQQDNDIFYIPQQPYLTTGSLRENVIYPDTVEQMRAKGVTDEDLEYILEQVFLKYIPPREGGWDACNEWVDVLSGGEKQRMALARLFYHKPRFAIMDECTSAVSQDVEGELYLRAKAIGVTLLTVSHRHHVLAKYHTHLLKLDGDGNWDMLELHVKKSEDEAVSLKQEKSNLESQISESRSLRDQLQSVCKMLGEDSDVLDMAKKIL